MKMRAGPEGSIGGHSIMHQLAGKKRQNGVLEGFERLSSLAKSRLVGGFTRSVLGNALVGSREVQGTPLKLALMGLSPGLSPISANLSRRARSRGRFVRGNFR